MRRGVLVQTRAGKTCGKCALAVQHTCFTDSCTFEPRLEARHDLLLAELRDERMGGRGANTTLQITYLNSVVMPDEESSSSGGEASSSEDDGDEISGGAPAAGSFDE